MKKLLRRFVSLVLVVSVLAAAFVYRPPKANAFAVTTGAIVAGVCAIMASIGVSYWAKSTTDAQDYISGKLSEYLQTLSPSPASLQDWLGLVAENTLTIFEILSGNRLRFTADVGNKILDFCRWFVSENDITSGGESVVESVSIWANQPLKASGAMGTPLNSWQWEKYGFLISGKPGETQTVEAIAQKSGVYVCRYGNNVLCASLTWSSVWPRSASGIGHITLDNTDEARGILYGEQGVKAEYWQGEMYTPVYSTKEEALDALALVLTGEAPVVDVARVTPSDYVKVPDAIPEDETIVVVPSATVAESMTVDDAADSILEGVASSEGLTAEVDEPATMSGILDVLQGIRARVSNIYRDVVRTLSDIKEAILDLPARIAEAVRGLFVPNEAFIDSYVATLYGDFDNHFSILSYPFSVLGEFITRLTQSSQQEPIFSWGDVQEPFSGRIIIPAGSYNLNDSLQNSTFAYAHSLYFIVVKGWISFWFLTFLYNWFCDVFKMREADMENPNLDEDFV